MKLILDDIGEEAGVEEEGEEGDEFDVDVDVDDDEINLNGRQLEIVDAKIILFYFLFSLTCEFE